MKFDNRTIAMLEAKESKDYKPSAAAKLLPFIPTDKKEVSKDKQSTYELRTVPTQADSAKYKQTINHISLKSEIRDAIKWKKTIEKIFKGLNLGDNFANKKAIIETTVSPDLLRAFDMAVMYNRQMRQQTICNQTAANRRTAGDDEATVRAAVEAVGLPDEGDADFIPGIRGIMNAVVPAKALEKIKRYLRRECRKPAEMSIRTWYTHFNMINKDELPELPPFLESNSIQEDEMKDIFLHSIPNSWEKQMHIQGFDPMVRSLPDLLTFCERLEVAEDMVHSDTVKHVKKKKKTSHGGGKNLVCALGHRGHSTEDCETLKRLKSEHENRKKGNITKSSGSFSYKSKNKTWSRKDSESKGNGKKDLAAFIQDTVKKSLKSELNAFKEMFAAEQAKKDDDANDLDLDEMDFGDLDSTASGTETDDNDLNMIDAEVEGEIDV